MNASALELYLAETAALSIIGNIDASGFISGAIENRHKIRAKDIKDFLDLCAKSPPHSSKRLLMVAYLMCYSSAAYAEVGALVAAVELKSVDVTPHYGKGKMSLRDACISEPMNLWPGSGVENKKKKDDLFDPHLTVGGYINGETIRLPSVENPDVSKKKLSDGQKVGRALMNSRQSVAGFSTMPIVPDFVRTFTPVSSGLNDSVIPAYKGYAYMAGNKDLINRVDQASRSGIYNVKLRKDLVGNRTEEKERFVLARSLVGRMTTAGESHYDKLIVDLTQRKNFIAELKLDDLSKKISEARTQWVNNRFKLKSALVEAVRKINAASADPSTGVDFYLNIKY